MEQNPGIGPKKRAIELGELGIIYEAGVRQYSLLECVEARQKNQEQGNRPGQGKQPVGGPARLERVQQGQSRALLPAASTPGSPELVTCERDERGSSEQQGDSDKGPCKLEKLARRDAAFEQHQRGEG